MAKYNIKAVFESSEKWDKNLADLEVNLRKNILIDKVSRGNYTVSITAHTDNTLFLVNALGYTAACENLDFYFIITNYEDTFFTNDVDGKYFPTLFYVDANLPSGILKTNFDSELEIIDDIEDRMKALYPNLEKALEAINNYLKSIDEDYYYIVKDYVVFENDEWIEEFAK